MTSTIPVQKVVASTQYWLSHTVIEHNFCPFARREFVKKSIKYHVSSANGIENALYELADALQLLDRDSTIETTLIVYPSSFDTFDDYLDLVEFSTQLLDRLKYSGTYQIATFHPDYCFEGLKPDDPANYTNRSPYPMIHLLREASLERALEHYDDPGSIPDNNIQIAREKGIAHFERILQQAKKASP
ncbi:DUF1415 domain-containing protein [Kangiella sediminilitoris]|uniref:Lipoprotein signal peptidase n=1 Tax=Kangiella sediminilitoris TaxID=1144748 RepID=A0A1B3BDW4_9GAMM|nr:DUF1415 domain-containing protein [Kangiella sediminilitoris]AOE50958.1 lipoprotein signal peptidase [Kangiella sediminilitoris]